MQENLVIVESPAKAKTIEKFLGKDYVVKSSYGHVRDLVKKDLGIDIEHGFTPFYEVAPDKKNVVSDLAKLAAGARTVWLASDEDREGEAIAWHLAQVLNLPVDKTKRIVFHEITRSAILSAVENPRTIDMNLVDAQQARRILDRLVGFELSPVLWKKVKPQLSAGRVQSVAVRLLVEREREIIDFRPAPYYRVTGRLMNAADPSKTIFRAELNRRFDDRAQAMEFIHGCVGASYRVSKAESKPGKKSPAPPFTTSTLQQEAGRKLGMSVSQTMSVAQKLYESGLITYMRTDSVNLAGQAIAAAREAVTDMFGARYSEPRNFKTKTKGAQEAHEAIRPSYMDRRGVEGAPTEKKLYELIWKRTVASQMAAAEVERTTVNIDISGRGEQFVAVGEVVKFDGFLKLYTESVDDETEAAQGGLLPAMKEGDMILHEDICATERVTQQPPRYSEAALVKRLEELGIGRPSTYAPTITTIINRGYVVKQNKEGVKREYDQIILGKKGDVKTKTLSETVGREKNKLSPTDIGMVVNDYLENQFRDIMDYNFTARVEKEFDEIADGEKKWQEMITDFYGPFHNTVDKALEEAPDRSGQQRVLGMDPATGKEVVARIGRYGPMVQIGGSEDGEKARFAGLKKGQLIASITLEEALDLFSLPRVAGEIDGMEVVVGIGKYGPYVRYDGKFTSLTKGDDPYTLSIERAAELIKAKEQMDRQSREPMRTFEEDKALQVLNGRYGPYISYKGKNYRIPKGKDPNALSYEEAKTIVESGKK